MTKPDYRALCQTLLQAIDRGDDQAEREALNHIRAGLKQGHGPSDKDLLELMRNHPLRTSIILAAKEMAEYHNDAGYGARRVVMFSNVIDYTRLVLRVYGNHDS